MSNRGGAGNERHIPNYAALVKLLPTLRNLVDGCGEVTLTVEEAERIQSLGFAAEAGRWKAPPLPFELVRDNPLVEHLSIGWNPTQAEATPNRANTKDQSCEVTANRIRPAPAKTILRVLEPVLSEQTPKGRGAEFPRQRKAGYQLPPSPQEQMRMAEEAASRIERTLNRACGKGKRLKVRDLQHRHWRFPASVFHQAMCILERTGRVSCHLELNISEEKSKI